MKRPATHTEWVQLLLQGKPVPGNSGFNWSFGEVFGDFQATDTHDEIFRELATATEPEQITQLVAKFQGKFWNYCHEVAHAVYTPPTPLVDPNAERDDDLYERGRAIEIDRQAVEHMTAGTRKLRGE